jgi:septum formation protein
MNLKYPLVLASNSPRRQQLLTQSGFVFSLKTKDTPEDFPLDMPVEEVPLLLARRKAAAVRDELTDEIVLAADTVVVIDGQILNKPQDNAEAFQMLSMLSGRKHEVITGVCVTSAEKTVTFSDLTEVFFKKLTVNEIDFYVKNFQPFDKAGAYGAQEWMGMIAIEKIIGSYFNVMGLPVHQVYDCLKNW